MTAGGFSSALTAFTGQNYGAKKYDRVEEGYRQTLIFSVGLGIITTLLLVFFGREIFSIFIPEQEAIAQGADYLKILGYSQILMCIEITTAGAFFGVGKTIPPSVVGIIFTGLRVPMAMILSREDLLGINGVWWTISISSMIKGVVLLILFLFIVVKPMRNKQIEIA